MSLDESIRDYRDWREKHPEADIIQTSVSFVEALVNENQSLRSQLDIDNAAARTPHEMLTTSLGKIISAHREIFQVMDSVIRRLGGAPLEHPSANPETPNDAAPVAATNGG